MVGYLTFGAVAGALGHRAVFTLAVGATLTSAAIVFAFRRAPALAAPI